MKKLMIIMAIVALSISANAQQPKAGITRHDLIKKKRVVTWVCSVENLSTPRLKIKANVVAASGKNETITVTSNLNLERIAFYTYDNRLAITIGVVGSGELFKAYTFDFSGVNGDVKDKGINLLCYFKGSTKPDATIIVTPLITYK